MANCNVILDKKPPPYLEDKIAKFLSTITQQKSDELLALIQQAPVTLYHDLPLKKAVTLVESINKIGARCHLEIIQPEVEVEESFLGQQFEVPPSLTPTNITPPLKQSKFKRKPLMVTLFIIVFFGSAFIFQNFFLNQSVKKITPPTLAKSQSLPDKLLTPFKFKMSKKPGHDKRLVQGLVLSIKTFAQLYLSPKQLQTLKIKHQSRRITNNQTKIIFNIEYLSKKSNYKILISNLPSKVNHNFLVINQLFSKFLTHYKLNQLIPATNNIQVTNNEFRDHFEYLNFFNTLHDLETKLKNKTLGHVAFLKMSEMHAWLAFFKSARHNKKLSELLIIRSIAFYIISQNNPKEKTSDFHLGLISLALGYSKNALTLLSNNQQELQQVAKLLSAYIKYDIQYLTYRFNNYSSDKRLIGYLLTRSYRETGQPGESYELQKKMMKDYPNFLLYKSYLSLYGSIDLRKQYALHSLFDLMEKQLILYKKYVGTQWLKDNKLLIKLTQKETYSEDVLIKWLSINQILLTNTKKNFKHKNAILTPEFFVNFFENDIKNSIYHSFDLEISKNAQTASKKLLQTINTLFPDSNLYYLLKLQYLMKFKKADNVISFMKKIPLQQAHLFLLETMLNSSSKHVKQWSLHPYITKTLNQFINKSQPNSVNYFQLAKQLNHAGYSNLAKKFIANAIKIDPYQSRYYQLLSQLPNTTSQHLQGKQYLKHSYGYDRLMAYWLRHKNNQESRRILTELIKTSPNETSAYLQLSQYFMETKQYRQALDILKQYPDNTPQSTSIQQQMAKIYFILDENEASLKIYNKFNDIQSSANIINYAHSLEKANQHKEAELQLTTAVNQYPYSESAIELSLFYLRYNKEKLAIKILKKYMRYHKNNYYFATLINNFPVTKVMKIVKQVESNTLSDNLLAQLAKEFSQQSNYQQAAKILKPLAFKINNSSNNSPYFYAIKYYNNLNHQSKEQAKQALNMLVLSYKTRPEYIEKLGLMFFNDKQYSIAYRLFKARLKYKTEQPGELLSLMALTWKLGNLTKNGRLFIENKIRQSKVTRWQKKLYQLIFGQISHLQLLPIAKTRSQLCEIYFFHAVNLMKKQDFSVAETYLLMSLETLSVQNIEYSFALNLLMTKDW